MIYLFDAEAWLWDARQGDSWVFVSLPEEASVEIREVAGALPRGFGSVRVTVTLGATVWKTSIFPDAKAGVYVLPLKKAVRKAEGVEAGDTVTVKVELDL
ncbi:MAG: DUF1905 domain-containing protein [Pseudolysinimonas sp.]|uniref:DUF1905 domain-containing protein n=1 Tax=Pseudolysinimonas sp. TaxID=2680009 RepID=UPI003C75154E